MNVSLGSCGHVAYGSVRSVRLFRFEPKRAERGGSQIALFFRENVDDESPHFLLVGVVPPMSVAVLFEGDAAWTVVDGLFAAVFDRDSGEDLRKARAVVVLMDGDLAAGRDGDEANAHLLAFEFPDGVQIDSAEDIGADVGALGRSVVGHRSIKFRFCFRHHRFFMFVRTSWWAREEQQGCRGKDEDGEGR